MIFGEQTAGRGVEPRQQPLPGIVEPDVVGGKVGIGADFLVGFGGGMGAVECGRVKGRGMAICRGRRPDCEIVAGQLIDAPAIEVGVIIFIENFVARQHPQTVACRRIFSSAASSAEACAPDLSRLPATLPESHPLAPKCTTASVLHVCCSLSADPP